MASISNCIGIVNRLSESDANAVLSKLEEYGKRGVPVAEAQRLAVQDVLDQARADLAAMQPKASNERSYDDLSPGEQARYDSAFEPEDFTDQESTGWQNLQLLSKNDALFQLPRSRAKSIYEIAADLAPGVTVKESPRAGGYERVWQLTIPTKRGEVTAKLFDRSADAPSKMYAYELDDVGDGESRMTNIITERPGQNTAFAENKDDVWISVENLKSGEHGGIAYAIAAAYAYNNGKIFIGDPQGLTGIAMHRRVEHMLSSALKYGTTAHLGPHPDQLKGVGGTAPIRWTYGDDLGNIKSLIDASIANYGQLVPISFDYQTGRYTDREGRVLDGDSISRAVREGRGRENGLGVTTAKRVALLKSLVQAEGGQGSAADGRADGVLARVVPVMRQSPDAVEGILYSAERDVTLTFTQAQKEEIEHKLSILAEEQDLQDSYGVSPEEVAVLQAEFSKPAGAFSLSPKYLDILRGELENAQQIAEDNLQSGDDSARGKLASMRQAIKKIDAAIARQPKASAERNEDDKDLNNFRADMLRRIKASMEYGDMLARQHEWAYNIGDVFLSSKTGKTYRLTDRRFQRVGPIKDNNWRPVYYYEATDGERGAFPEKNLLESKTMVNLTTPRMSTERTDTPEFKRWFGDSKVVDADGKPLVVYHGTTADFSVFKNAVERGGDPLYAQTGIYFAEDAMVANVYGESGSIYPVYLSIKNPLDLETRFPSDSVRGALVKAISRRVAARLSAENDLKDSLSQSLIMQKERDQLLAQGFDGVRGLGGVWIAFRPEQIKSAVGNNGDFDPANTDIRYSTVRESVQSALDKAALVDLKSAMANRVKNAMISPFMSSEPGEFNWWHKTIGTQFHKATANPAFARVFNIGQQFIEDTSLFAQRAESLARSIFPGAELSWAAIKNWGLSQTENTKVGQMLAAGTLENGANPHTGVVWTDEQLREKFSATDREITAYREARAAIDQSLADYAKSEMAHQVRITTAGMGDEVKRHVAATLGAATRGDMTLLEAQELMNAVLTGLGKLGAKVEEARKTINAVASTTANLQRAGYAPLMRFGSWGVSGFDKDGTLAFFTMVNSKAEARAMQLQLEENGEIATVKVAEMNPSDMAEFRGMTPETAALFAQLNGMDKNEGVQAFLRTAVSTRSVLQRMQKRHGYAGFSHDATRTVASFITGNARKASSNLNMADLHSARMSKDLTGSARGEAAKLVEYLENPQEEAARLRGLLFANYLGGSIASGLVNLTQPLMMTLPYLSQWGVKNAGAALTASTKDATRFLRGQAVGDADLQRALELAKSEGILDPNEVFQLMAAAQQGAGSFGMQKFMRVWGVNFQITEAFNRTLTFAAAYRVARDMTPEQLSQALNTTEAVTAAEFAANAIRETQGVYNKGNRPNWARGAIGATIFTFKQFSIAYLEFLRRLWGDNVIPKKQFAVAIALLVLAAGVNGLPGADDLDDIVDSMGKLLGYNTNSKKWKRDMLAEVLGKDFAEAVQDGVSHYLPFDVAGRLGAGNFIPGTKLLDPSQSGEAKRKSVLEVFGVAGSALNSYISALGSMAAGDYRAAGYSVAPTAIANLAKGAEMMATGQFRDMGGRKVVAVDSADAITKALGFQPREVADDSQAQRIARADIETQRWKQSSINHKYARAVVERDQELMTEVRTEMVEWNKRNPEARVKLDPATIKNQVRSLTETREQRTVRTAPKVLRADVKKTMEQ